MHGAGTKLAITTNNPPPARLLDLTRIARRAGRVPTGVDRVEIAYAKALLAEPVPVFGLVRISLGYVLLSRDGVAALMDRVLGRLPWGAPDHLSRISRKLDTGAQAVESDLRRFALARCLPQRLGKMLAKHLPQSISYINTGHSNLTDRVLFTVKQNLNARISVLLHDTIPLDFPQFQRRGTPEQFRAMLKRVRAYADLLICNSDQTRRDVQRHMSQWGPVPQAIVAHLGVDLPETGAPVFPGSFDHTRAYFTTIGTIEPRKNHTLLLDVWDRLAAQLDLSDMPQLLICGARGWNNDALFRRLDESPIVGRHVFEMSGLPDAAVMGLVKESAGMLFPSLTEGYGLPPIESAALGVPTLCNSLEIYQETLGDIAVYADVNDVYLWETIISNMARDKRAGSASRKGVKAFSAPGWDVHFNTVLTYV